MSSVLKAAELSAESWALSDGASAVTWRAREGRGGVVAARWRRAASAETQISPAVPRAGEPSKVMTSVVVGSSRKSAWS